MLCDEDYRFPNPTVYLLSVQVGMMLKPFLPQLQTTFVKALNDPNRSVRLKAAAALGNLIVIHVRVDPLFTELFTGVKCSDDTSIKWVAGGEGLWQVERGCGRDLHQLALHSAASQLAPGAGVLLSGGLNHLSFKWGQGTFGACVQAKGGGGGEGGCDKWKLEEKCWRICGLRTGVIFYEIQRCFFVCNLFSLRV